MERKQRRRRLLPNAWKNCSKQVTSRRCVGEANDCVHAMSELCWKSKKKKEKKKKRKETLLGRWSLASHISIGVRHVSDTNTLPKMVCRCNLASTSLIVWFLLWWMIAGYWLLKLTKFVLSIAFEKQIEAQIGWTGWELCKRVNFLSFFVSTCGRT